MWPFTGATKKDKNRPRSDVFWLRDANRIDGVIAVAARILSSNSHVLLITHNADRVDRLAEAAKLASLPLDRLATPVTTADLLARLQDQPRPSALLALASMLLPPAARTTAAPIQPITLGIVVADHHLLRAHDDAIVAFARSLATAPVEFHLSADDPLLRAFRGDRTAQTLRAMGMKDNESVSHRMLTRSVRRAQEKIAMTCPDHGKVESWLAELLRK
jgi:hypothetical protein